MFCNNLMKGHIMKLPFSSLLTPVLVAAIALIFASCAAPPPPTTAEDIQIMKNLQGTWAGGAMSLKIKGQEVTYHHQSAHPILDSIDPTRKLAPQMDNDTTSTYSIIDGKMVFRSPISNCNLIFTPTGPDTMKGYRDDGQFSEWIMHRVVEKK